MQLFPTLSISTPEFKKMDKVAGGKNCEISVILA